MAGLGAAVRARRVLVGLTLLHQVPTGMALAAWVVTAQARGTDADAVGVLVAVVAFGTALLELPTGGLADVLGRRGVLAAAALLDVVAFALLATQGAMPALLAVAVLLAVAGALSSGPLEAWFVDRVRTEADQVRDGMAAAGTATGAGLALGGLLGGVLALAGRAAGLPDTGPTGLVSLSVPLALAAALRLLEAGLLLRLLREAVDPGTGGPPGPTGSPGPPAGADAPAAGPVARVPLGEALGTTVLSAARLALTDPVLRWFCLRWALVPVGFLALELLSPVRLVDLLGDPALAASVMGPLAAGCFLGSGLTAALAPRVARRLGTLPAAAGVTVAAGACFALAGTGGVVVLAAAVLAGFLVSGPVNPLLAPLVHERVDGARRATLLSVRSLVGNCAVGVGALLLGGLGHSSGSGWAFAAAGAVTVLGALPLLGVHRAREGGGDLRGSGRTPLAGASG